MPREQQRGADREADQHRHDRRRSEHRQHVLAAEAEHRGPRAAARPAGPPRRARRSDRRRGASSGGRSPRSAAMARHATQGVGGLRRVTVSRMTRWPPWTSPSTRSTSPSRGRSSCRACRRSSALPLDQRRADGRRGLRTGAFVSGYQGSPLGGLDQRAAPPALAGAEHDVVVPARRQRGARRHRGLGHARWSTLPGARYDGVLGVWYGKAPGVDRAARRDPPRATSPAPTRTAACSRSCGDDPG